MRDPFSDSDSEAIFNEDDTPVYNDGYEDDEECECESCASGFEAFAENEAEKMRKYGFVVHAVIDQEHPNVHSHGLQESMGHLDFQVVAQVHPECGHGIICNFVDRIKKGERFEPWRDYDNIIMDYKVRLVPATDNNRPVLRVILPDKAGVLDKESMDEDLADQYEGVFDPEAN